VDGGRWTVDGGRWTVDGGRWTVDGGSSRLRLEYLAAAPGNGAEFAWCFGDDYRDSVAFLVLSGLGLQHPSLAAAKIDKITLINEAQ
jgi:hypothetical protein